MSNTTELQQQTIEFIDKALTNRRVKLAIGNWGLAFNTRVYTPDLPDDARYTCKICALAAIAVGAELPTEHATTEMQFHRNVLEAVAHLLGESPTFAYDLMDGFEFPYESVDNAFRQRTEWNDTIYEDVHLIDPHKGDDFRRGYTLGIFINEHYDIGDVNRI